jgi:opine dehydrogenase
MAKENITIIGGGNGAHAMAADLALAGHAVTLFEFPGFAPKMNLVLDSGAIEFHAGSTHQVVHLARATTDIALALREATWVMVVVPSFGHEAAARACAPHLQDGQRIAIFAGTFGSIVFRHTLNQQNCRAKVHVIETSTLPYGARMEGPGVVDCPLRAVRVLAAAFPADGQSVPLKSLQEIFPVISPGRNVAEVALSNVNPIVHPVGALLNAGRIEYSKGEFFLYEEGITQSVAKAIRAMHREFTAVGEAIGVEPAQYDEKDFAPPTSITSTEFRSEFDTPRVIAGFKGPFNIKEDRYVSEDVPYGLVPVASLADLVCVEVPTVRATIQLFSVMNDTNYWEQGWTCEKLGINDLNVEQLQQYFQYGSTLVRS